MWEAPKRIWPDAFSSVDALKCMIWDFEFCGEIPQPIDRTTLHVFCSFLNNGFVLYCKLVCVYLQILFWRYAHTSGVLFLWSLLFQGLVLCAFAGDYAGFPGCGLLRLHSTYRHDLKIYASDEGRVQMTAAAFAKVCLGYVCRDMLVLHNAFRWNWC